jgi:heme/copper-type cytochrome/quinol oxidase subunit 2
MYIVFGSIIFIIIVLFGSSIFSMVKTYTSNPNPSFKIGNLWFITLLIINITVIVFIYTFYYYKSIEVGKLGSDGDRGFKGKEGEPCFITIPNSMYYQNYNKIEQIEKKK